ncbi:MAG: nucleotide sugar dehydrogenase [Aestuariibacter sp.]
MTTEFKARKISIIGLGYVGAVSSACLADMGHSIVGVDIDDEKTKAINAGESPIHEPGLEELIQQQVKSGRLRATTDIHQAVAETDISFVCVGTPTTDSGEINLAYIKEAVREITLEIKKKQQSHIVIMRSTVPPGTAKRVIKSLVFTLLNKEERENFHYVSNPEFLREGTAIYDFSNPPKTLIGGRDTAVLNEVAAIYQKVDAPVVTTHLGVAEMLKYVNNTWHALKVAFANEVGSLSRELGVDGHEVMDIFCQDTKLNLSSYYLRPGFAFGGSCLPKDVRGLTGIGRDMSLSLPLMNSIIPSNNEHINRAYEMVVGPGVKSVTILGISFKANTDDIRESPMVILANRLRKRGFDLLIYDANVNESILTKASSANIIEMLDSITENMCTDLQYAIDKADVVVIGNDHEDFDKVLEDIPADKRIVDLVRISEEFDYDNYEGIGW